VGVGRLGGFKGSRKSTPFAAQVTRTRARGRAWSTAAEGRGLVKGPGSGARRRSAPCRRGLEILGVKDVTHRPITACGRASGGASRCERPWTEVPHLPARGMKLFLKGSAA